MDAIKNRYEFVMLFDVENGNPNGDPDAGNQPRIDPETNLGIVTDVCLKRKIRNYVELVKEGDAGYNILIKNDRSLNSKFTEAYESQGLEKGKKGETEMGKKSIVYYGLYKAEGYISAALAQKVTGFSDDDLELLWNAVINMFENDRSAARGKMCMRKLYIFKHDSVLGNAPAHVLFDKIKVQKNTEAAPRSFSDYNVSIDAEMPNGVELIEKL